MNEATSLADLLLIMDMSESDVNKNIQRLTALRESVKRAMYATKGMQNPFQVKIDQLNDLITILTTWQQTSH